MTRAPWFATLALLALCSCAGVPSEKALQEAHYGDRPAGNYQNKIRSAFAGILLDPASARYKFGNPEQGWGRGEGGFVFGWVVWTQVNSENQFGAFTGWQSYKVLVREAEVHSIYEPAGTDMFGNDKFNRLK